MRAMAVRPIANPVKARRANGLGRACRKADVGCCKRTVKLHADTMNSPRHAASIRYSGQCFVSAATACLRHSRFGLVNTTEARIISFVEALCICPSDSPAHV